jgi:hypothetical protein
MKRLVFLLPLLFMAGCGGCRDRATSAAGNKSQWQESNVKWQDELLPYAVDNLDQMEKFQTQENLFLILRQINSLQQSPANKDNNAADTLAAAWPESEIFTQTIDRINQWLHIQAKSEGWKPDPLLKTLPEQFKELPLVKGVGGLDFSAYDGYVLQESSYLRDISLWARGDVLDDLSRAKNLFAWTVRNIQLESDDKERLPLFPWETLLFGRGTGMERAWVFILLARQQGLEAAVLSLPDLELGESSDGKPKPLRQWCAAVLIDGKAYLFDPVLGMPIPAKDGVKRDSQGRLDILPATLAEVAADPALLRRLDVDSNKTYPVKASDLGKLTAMVEASPAALSYRMKLIESRLAGQQKMVLTFSAGESVRRWETQPGVVKAEIWLLPYETIRRRSRLSAAEIAGQLSEFMRYYALPGAPLAKGRLLQLKGQFPGQEGATGFYQAARPSLNELGFLSDLPSSGDLDKMRQDLLKRKNELTKAGNDPSVEAPRYLAGQKQDVEEKVADVDLAKMARKMEDEYANIRTKAINFKSDEEKNRVLEALRQQAMQILVANILFGKEDATYWLALVAFDRGNYSSAENYLSKMILEKSPNSPWRHGAYFNLAQIAEVSGQIERAAMYFQIDPDAPDNYGRLLRARWLQEKQE